MSLTAAEVLAMVQEDGVSAVFNTYATPANYDATDGGVSRGARTAHPVTVIPPNADAGVVKQFGNVDGVKEASLFSLVPASGLSFEPYVGQEFVWDSQTWAVTWINPIRSNAGVLAYQFGIRGKA